MADNSPKFPLVRCPKCGRLLPELPPYSVYRCGGCNGFLQAAHKNSPLRDNLSSNSSEGRFSGGVVGIDHDSERSTPTRVSNSPLRPKFGDPTRKSPVRETNTDGLNAHRNSPKRETVLGDFDVQSKSPLRETGYGHGKSPAISVRGGVEKAPIIGSDDREEQVDSEDIEARDRVDSVDESYADWLHRESIMDHDQIRVNRHSVLPRRLRTRHKAAQVGRRTDCSDEEYYKVHGRRGAKQPNDDLDDEDDHGVERRNIHRSTNYRTELLREYSELHEKLIRMGDLITYSKSGKRDQGYASISTDCYGGSYDNVYDEFSGNRIRTVRSAGMKGSSRMRPHYVSEDSSLPQIHERTIHRQPPNNCQKFATQQPNDSSYDPRREYPHQRYSVDDQSDEGFSAHDHKKKALLVNQNGQLCHPIVGGAPFVICPKCFQLLRLTGKLITTKRSQFRLQCGICHTILSLEFNKKRSEVASDSAVNSSMSDLLPLGSPLRDHKDRINATKSSDKKESDQDKGTACRESFAKSCVGNAAVPTELEVKSSEIPKTDSSQDSADTSIRRDGGCNEASEIHFASVIKGGFQDSSSPNLGTSHANVSVNGMVINPDAVRKAEKMAGPISPGEYWYDSRAGFWGAMGDHCLGIIPPFIQEFSSEMAANCSGGETCIFVNGRELHENDLDLLSGRGLPRTRYKYYVVDISGKVQDEDTGGFVVNLGKLAPTVESTGCGFGMHSTKALKY